MNKKLTKELGLKVAEKRRNSVANYIFEILLVFQSFLNSFEYVLYKVLGVGY